MCVSVSACLLLCRFWVRQELLFEFLRHWVAREGQLQQQEGFLGLQVGGWGGGVGGGGGSWGEVCVCVCERAGSKGRKQQREDTALGVMEQTACGCLPAFRVLSCENTPSRTLKER